MPRDSGGTYSLPAGNPVTTLTVISSTWANTTLSDISTALTGSLDRSGQGAMLAGLKLFDGTIGAPGLTWGTETTSGIYRNAAGDFRFAIGGVDVFRFNTGGSIGLFNNGSAGAPAISWVSEPTSGFYRVGAGDFRYVIGSADLLALQANLFQLSGTAPAIRINEHDAAANNRLWDVIATGEDLAFRTLTDTLVSTNWLTVSRTAGTIDRVTVSGTLFDTAANVQFTKQATNSTPSTASVAITSPVPILVFNESGVTADNRLWAISAQSETLLFRAWNDAGSVQTTWMEVNRTGTTIDNVRFPSGTLLYGGFEVGYRNLIHRNFNGNDSTLASDNGRAVAYGNTGGHTFTIDTDFTTNNIVTIFNIGSGSITIAESLSGNMLWSNGSGTLGTGSRTLAVGGIATVWMTDANNAVIWGIGLT